MPRQSAASRSTRLKLKPADPFELIRWLARSQSDPRKAVAELVQNSLDAEASRVRIVRRRVRKTITLAIEDDGRGVIPELGRAEALKYLATHIGHSRKRRLSPQQRAEQVVAGKYGVGLLGFWSIGKQLELRTRVGGSETMVLRLEEDSRDASMAAVPHGLDAPDTYTHVVVGQLHPAASRALSGKRLAHYLAAELRGQLLQRDVQIVVEDRLVRGRGDKLFPVRPRAFVGERVAVPAFVQVAGHRPARVELYFGDGAEVECIQVACAGTRVADDIAELSALGLSRAPWVGCGLSGIVDFDGFSIPPGTRRGVLPDAAAAAFVAAMTDFAALVRAQVDLRQREMSAVVDRQIIRDLRHALRGFRRRLPQYDFPVASAEDGPDSSPEPSRVVAGPVHSEPRAPTPPLLAPGPLASVAIKPANLELAVGKERRVRAAPVDTAGRVIADGVTFAWSVVGESSHAISIAGSGRAVTLIASEGTAAGTECEVHVDAVAEVRLAQAVLHVVVVAPDEDGDAGERFGVADPEMHRDPAGQWRSRMLGERWQINEAHEDFVSVRGNAKARLRYVLALLAKEMVQRAYGRPGDDRLLEHMVEVLAHAERNLRGR